MTQSASPLDRFHVRIVARAAEFPLAERQPWLRAGASEVEVGGFDGDGRDSGSGSSPDLLVLRASPPELHRLLAEAQARFPGCPVAVWSPDPSVQGAVEAIRAGAIDYLPAIPEPAALAGLVQRAKAHRAAALEREEREEDFPVLLGDSPAMRRLRSEIAAVARPEATVLLQGETGTGKERAARLIHRLSARASRPFVVCNCSAVVPSLAESELFGHERGAFTGARRAKPGLFEVARGGTLFLDQVQELPPALQPKLLRVLENREFCRLGSTRPQTADVRIVCAANRDLRQEVREGRFREDLYYRLSTAVLTIPPLRERREDIPLLVEHFLVRFSRRFGKPTRFVSREAMNWIMNHPWEGNVRELRNTLERAVAVSRRSVITQRELRLDPSPPSPSAPAEYGPAELISLDELERRQIRRVLEMTGGNRERAARALGISRSTLYRRLAELGF